MNSFSGIHTGSCKGTLSDYIFFGIIRILAFARPSLTNYQDITEHRQATDVTLADMGLTAIGKELEVTWKRNRL